MFLIAFGGIKGWYLCPSINQSPIRATLSTGRLGDPRASIRSEIPQERTLRAAAAAAPRLHRRSRRVPQSRLIGGELGLGSFLVLFISFLF